MFHTIASQIVFILIRKDYLDGRKRELYEYGMESVLLNFGVMFATLVISMVFQELNHYAMFLIIFVPIRVFLGGLHLKTSGLCMLGSIMFYIFTLWVHPYCSSILTELYVLLVIISIVSVRCSPLYNKEHLNCRKNKKIANNLIIMNLVINAILIVKNNVLEESAVVYGISVLLFFLIEKIKRRVKGESE